MRYYLIILCTLGVLGCNSESAENQVPNYSTVFENSKGKATATYQETLDFYIKLAKDFPEISIQVIGDTDSGFPLHIVTFNPGGDFNFQNLQKEKTLVLINNGIHPGESDGIDASMLLFRDLATDKINAPKNVVLVTIPIYNIGCLLYTSPSPRDA